MKKILYGSMIACCFGSSVASDPWMGTYYGRGSREGADSLPLEVGCDRASHRYEIGESAYFFVRSERKCKVNVTLTVDGCQILKKFQAKTPASFAMSLPFPSFLRCTVEAEGQKTVKCGVAYAPEQIRPLIPEPSEFEIFWKKALEELASIPADIHFVRRGPGVYSIDCATVNGQRQYGFLALPDGPGPHPLVVTVGGGEAWGTLDRQQIWRGNGVNAARLFIHLPPYAPADTWDEGNKRHAEYLKEIGQRRFIFINMDKTPRDLYLYPAILGGLRLIEAAANRKDIDSRRIVYTGASHGGGFGIYYTALSPYIRAAYCGVPNFGDVGGFLTGRHNSDSDPEFRGIWEKMLFFDSAFFAKRIHVPVLMSVGFHDPSCSPTAVYSIYNALRGEKIMLDKVIGGHGDIPPEHEAMIPQWLSSHLLRKCE